jgi:hypothetical protein
MKEHPIRFRGSANRGRVRRPWPRFPLSRLAISLAGAACLPALTACTTHQCDPHTTVIPPPGDSGTSFWTVGCIAGAGCALEWRSSATDGPWTLFNGGDTLIFEFGPLPPLPAGYHADFSTAWPSILVAATPPTLDRDSSNYDAANYTIGTGQLAEFVGAAISPDSVQVTNGTCGGPYWALVAVSVSLVADDAAAPDAAAQDAAAQDAAAQDAAAQDAAAQDAGSVASTGDASQE